MIKLKEKHYNMGYVELLREFNLVDEIIHQCYPEKLKMNPIDIKKHQDNYRKFIKKSNPRMNKKHVEDTVRMQFFNYGPSDDDTVPVGYVIVERLE